MPDSRDVDRDDDVLFSAEDPSQNVENLVAHEHIIVERKDQIEKAIQSALDDPQTYNSPNHIFSNLEIAITSSPATDDFDEDDWDGLTSATVALVHTLIMKDAGMVELIDQENPSKEFQDFIIGLILDYGSELQRLNFYHTQGKHWWSFIRTERLFDEGSVKHKHFITIDRRDEVEIDSSPFSDWVLAEHFIREIFQAAVSPDVDIEEIMDIDRLNQIRQHVFAFEEAVKESDMDADLLTREELLGDGESEDEGVTNDG